MWSKANLALYEQAWRKLRMSSMLVGLPASTISLILSGSAEYPLLPNTRPNHLTSGLQNVLLVSLSLTPILSALFRHASRLVLCSAAVSP